MAKRRKSTLTKAATIERRKKVFRYYHRHNQTIEAIANRLGISINTVHNDLKVAESKLINRIESDYKKELVLVIEAALDFLKESQAGTAQLYAYISNNLLRYIENDDAWREMPEEEREKTVRPIKPVYTVKDFCMLKRALKEDDELQVLMLSAILGHELERNTQNKEPGRFEEAIGTIAEAIKDAQSGGNIEDSFRRRFPSATVGVTRTLPSSN